MGIDGMFAHDGPRMAAEHWREVVDETTKACPFCGSGIRPTAVLCRYCRKPLDEAAVARLLASAETQAKAPVPPAARSRLSAGTLWRAAFLALPVSFVSCCAFSVVIQTLYPAEFEELRESGRRARDARVAEDTKRGAEQEHARTADGVIAESEYRSVERSIGARPANSEWDGGVACVEEYVKSAAHDPGSIAFDSWTKVTAVRLGGQSYWSCRASYRGKNLLGALVREDKVFYVQNGHVVLSRDY